VQVELQVVTHNNLFGFGYEGWIPLGTHWTHIMNIYTLPPSKHYLIIHPPGTGHMGTYGFIAVEPVPVFYTGLKIDY
jgi:hypothetical protein